MLLPVPGWPITMLIEFVGKPPPRISSACGFPVLTRLVVHGATCSRGVASVSRSSAAAATRRTGPSPGVSSRNASAPDCERALAGREHAEDQDRHVRGGGVPLEQLGRAASPSSRGIMTSVMSAEGADLRTRSSAA